MNPYQITLYEIEVSEDPKARGFIFMSDPKGHVPTPQQMIDALSDYLTYQAIDEQGPKPSDLH